MNTLPKLLAVIAALSVLLAPQALAQRQLGKKKGPTSKLYLAETKGEGKIITAGKAYEPKQATAFDAPGTIIETKSDAHQVFVYSNGTVMYVEQDTRVEIQQFVQEPFSAKNSTTESEPSASQSAVFLAHGQIGIDTGQLVSGTTMIYSTILASVKIRGGKVSIIAKDESTTVYLLEGDATVHTGDRDLGGTLLRAGEKIVIRPGPPGQPPKLTLGLIDDSMLGSLKDMFVQTTNARQTVSFEVIERKAELGAGGPGNQAGSIAETGAGPGTETGAGQQEIVARPTVTATPPTNITVSPDRINPGPGGQ